MLAFGFNGFFFFFGDWAGEAWAFNFFVFKWQVGLVSLLWAETSVY